MLPWTPVPLLRKLLDRHPPAWPANCPPRGPIPGEAAVVAASQPSLGRRAGSNPVGQLGGAVPSPPAPASLCSSHVWKTFKFSPKTPSRQEKSVTRPFLPETWDILPAAPRARPLVWGGSRPSSVPHAKLCLTSCSQPLKLFHKAGQAPGANVAGFRPLHLWVPARPVGPCWGGGVGSDSSVFLKTCSLC